MIKKIMGYIPDEDNFERMLEFSPDEFEEIIGKKPVFEYSQEDVIKMTKEEYNVAFGDWETKVSNWNLTTYDSFQKWNFACLLKMDDDELEHLGWLCDAIGQSKVHNMDMESTAAFHTEGVYFNKDTELVIYNGR